MRFLFSFHSGSIRDVADVLGPIESPSTGEKWLTMQTSRHKNFQMTTVHVSIDKIKLDSFLSLTFSHYPFSSSSLFLFLPFSSSLSLSFLSALGFFFISKDFFSRLLIIVICKWRLVKRRRRDEFVKTKKIGEEEKEEKGKSSRDTSKEAWTACPGERREKLIK